MTPLLVRCLVGAVGFGLVACHGVPERRATDEPAPTTVTLPRTHTFALRRADGVAYEVAVALPRDFEHAAAPRVVYVLDPEYGFAVVRNIVEHLADRHHVGPTVVVGVGYPQGIEGPDWKRRYRLARTRDYTPTQSDIGYPDGVQDVSGGADAFLEFLERTVFVEVEKRFHTQGAPRVLVGHSYGGLFGAYAALARPGLFTAIVSVSPSLWYDHRFIFKYEQTKRDTGADLTTRLFLSAGALENVATDGDIAGDVERYAKQLSADFPHAQVASVVFPDERHDTIFPSAVARGLWWALEAH